MSLSPPYPCALLSWAARGSSVALFTSPVTVFVLPPIPPSWMLCPYRILSAGVMPCVLGSFVLRVSVEVGCSVLPPWTAEAAACQHVIWSESDRSLQESLCEKGLVPPSCPASCLCGSMSECSASYWVCSPPFSVSIRPDDMMWYASRYVCLVMGSVAAVRVCFWIWCCGIEL